MVETYAMFRELIAHQRLLSDKTSRIQGISEIVTELKSKLTYIEDSMSVLVKHMSKVDPMLVQ
jgi:uncharacterized coiled-coil protein SlyX